MFLPNGFYVNNYVGTYKIDYSPIYGEIIVSQENLLAKENEGRLKRKRIFESDSLEYEQIYTKFSNINIEQNEEILEYCNAYGLPYSSQIIRQKKLWMAMDKTNSNESTDADATENISQLSMEQLEMRDYMTLKGFHRSVILVRRLLQLQKLTGAITLNCSEYTELLSLLIFFLFFSQEYDFDYDPREDAIPKTQLLRFQYAFQLFRRKSQLSRYATKTQQIALFFRHCKFLKEMGEDAIESIHLWSLINSKSVENVMNLFAFLEASLVAKDEPDKEDLFSMDSYGEIIFTKNGIKELSLENRVEMRNLGKEVLCAVINDGLHAITPMLSFDGKELKGDWELNFQMAGIFMEIYMEITNQFLVRQCANPTCGKFFSVSRNRPNKIYCGKRCALIIAKRKERARKKAQAEQFKAENQPTEAQK